MQIANKNTFSDYFIIIALGLLLFMPFIGVVHLFDWDEANFGEAAREMVLTNNWLNPQIDYQLFWEKPPIFIWMQALSMKLFGINEFAARFPNTIIGVMTLCSLFFIGKRVSNTRVAWLWVFLYIGSWLPHFYFKSAIIDPTFNLLIFLSVYELFRASETKHVKHTMFSGILLGLAVLTKGPVAVLIVGLCGLVYITMKKNFLFISIKQYAVLILALIVTILMWLGIDMIKNGFWFTETFLIYQYRLFSTQDAGHGGPWFYHSLVLILGCFPASIFFLNAVLKKNFWQKNNSQNNFFLFMSILFFVHLILFSIVKTKIIHYSSLCYFPLTFWAAVELEKIMSGTSVLSKPVKFIGIFIGMTLGISITLLPVVGVHKDILMDVIKDDFTLGNLQAEVPFSYSEIIFGLMIIVVVCLIFYFISKKKNKNVLIFLIIHAVLISSTVSYFTPKLEQISQGGAVAFYKKAHQDNMYVYPYMMKSYAYLFYSQKPPISEKGFPKNIYDVFIQEEFHSKFYIVSKNIHKKKILEENPALQVLDEKAGYVLYKFK